MKIYPLLIVRAPILLLLLFILTSSNVEQPRILIIGDSISIGYTPFVKEHFEGTAVVEHNPGNAEHTGTGLGKINLWLGDRNWDIIQFNWGLWDLAYRNPKVDNPGNRDKVEGRQTFTVEEYEANLNSLVTIIKRYTKARLVFVTTSYVPDREPGRFEKDAKKFNKAAVRIMRKNDVEVNDIYKESIEIHRKYGLGNDDVHYSEEGYRALSGLIIAFLEKELQAIPKE